MSPENSLSTPWRWIYGKVPFHQSPLRSVMKSWNTLWFIILNCFVAESKRTACSDRRATRAPALAFEFVGLERAFLPPPAVTPRSYPRLTADAGPPAYRARPAHGAHSVGSIYAPSKTLLSHPTGMLTSLFCLWSINVESNGIQLWFEKDI